jgi:hypothetical protein
MNIGMSSIAVSVLLVSSGCYKSRKPMFVAPAGTSVMHKKGLVIYSSARPSAQKVEDTSTVWFQVPAAQELSGALRDPQSVAIANLRLELICAGPRKVAETDTDGNFSLGLVQPGECTISLGPGPWVAPTIECSAVSCAVRPNLSTRHAVTTVEITD